MGIEHGNRPPEEVSRWKVDEYFEVFGIPIYWALQLEKMGGELGNTWKNVFLSIERETTMGAEKFHYGPDPPPTPDQQAPENPAPPSELCAPTCLFSDQEYQEGIESKGYYDICKDCHTSSEDPAFPR